MVLEHTAISWSLTDRRKVNMNLENPNSKAARRILLTSIDKAKLAKKLKVNRRKEKMVQVALVFFATIVSVIVVASMVMWPVVLIAFICALSNGNWHFFFVTLIIAVVVHIIGTIFINN